MITLFTPKWRLWSQLHAYQLDRHTPQSIWSRLQPKYQMTTSCSHHPSLSCTSRSNLGWPYLTQVLGAASHLNKHLAHYRYLCTWQPCRCCPVTCIALNGVWLANPLSNHFFRYWDLCFFLQCRDILFIHFIFWSFTKACNVHCLLVQVLIASFSFVSPNQTMKARHKNAGIWLVGAMLWGWVLHFVYFAFWIWQTAS